jgi:hypothetical protein
LTKRIRFGEDENSLFGKSQHGENKRQPLSALSAYHKTSGSRSSSSSSSKQQEQEQKQQQQQNQKNILAALYSLPVHLRCSLQNSVGAIVIQLMTAGFPKCGRGSNQL